NKSNKRDEESLGEDASKQGRRIDAIDADDKITLVNDVDNEMFDVDALGGEEVFVKEQNENVVEEVGDAAQVRTAATTVTITTKEITLAQALEALKTLKPKIKRIVFQDPSKYTTTTTISLQQSQDKELVKGKEKRAGEEPEQEITMKQKVEDDKEKAEFKQLMETFSDEKEVAFDDIPLAVKSPRIIDWKIHKEGKKSYYQLVRADEKS
nr:hypothetical protein [Tanacetum cinerariifolium]